MWQSGDTNPVATSCKRGMNCCGMQSVKECKQKNADIGQHEVRGYAENCGIKLRKDRSIL